MVSGWLWWATAVVSVSLLAFRSRVFRDCDDERRAADRRYRRGRADSTAKRRDTLTRQGRKLTQRLEVHIDDLVVTEDAARW